MPRRAGVRIAACCRTSISRAPCPITAGLRWCAVSQGCSGRARKRELAPACRLDRQTRLSAKNRETFLETESWKLAGMAFVVLFALPGTVWLHSLLNQQTLMGNYPMRIRWQVHRYLLKQSMAFYQDEFAGRIATKLMQTALAVRECVIKLIDVLNYVIVYFLGML